MENNIGPQIRPNYLNTLDKLMNPSEIGNFKESKQHTFNEDGSIKRRYPTIFHRLENIEEHINLPQSKIKNIFHRLKLIEDKIIYLESISPEYRHFLVRLIQMYIKATHWKKSLCYPQKIKLDMSYEIPQNIFVVILAIR